MGDADNRRRSSVNSASRVCFSFAAYAKNVIDHLRRCQVPIARGLTDEEFERIEATFGFAFPPDLRSILREGLPVGVGFPNWRSGATQQLRMMMDLPMAGLSYEVSKGRFWWKDWGSQPYSSDEALRVAKTFFLKGSNYGAYLQPLLHSLFSKSGREPRVLYLPEGYLLLWL